MATGSGKTYTAVTSCYRLIKHAKAREAEGVSPAGLAAALLDSIDPDTTQRAAAQEHGLAEGEEPTGGQLDAVERKRMAEPLKTFTKPDLRQTIVDVNRSFQQVVDESAIDVLLDYGYNGARTPGRQQPGGLVGAKRVDLTSVRPGVRCPPYFCRPTPDSLRLFPDAIRSATFRRSIEIPQYYRSQQ